MEKIITNNLIASFDVAKPETYVGTGLTISSQVWKKQYKLLEIDTADYSRNLIDAGLGPFEVVTGGTLGYENKFVLTHAAPYDWVTETITTTGTTDVTGTTIDASGNTITAITTTITSSTEDITSVQKLTDQYNVELFTGDTKGSYYDLKGGYLIGNFGFDWFKGYDYAFLPKRYKEGFTIETTLLIKDDTFTNITGENDGFFLYMGARAENKLNRINIEEDINANCLGFRFTQDKQIGFRYIDEDGNIVEEYSEKVIPHSGWTIVNISYHPYGLIEKDSLIECFPRRKGELVISVNGLPYLDVDGFSEYWNHSFDGGAGVLERLGLPYSLSWGGGSFGLKHSWVQDEDGELVRDDTTGNLDIEKYFDGSFWGGVQKLRIYNKHMQFVEVRQNYNAEAEYYGLPKLDGGRIIEYGE